MQSETMSNAAGCVTEMGRISEKERGRYISGKRERDS